MDQTMIAAVAEAINQSPTQAVVIITGGGTAFFPMLTQRGGGSNTLLDARIPYATDATVELLGGKPDKLVSVEVARSLAARAFQMALRKAKPGVPVVGLALTAALQQTPTERKGREHTIYAALQTATKTVTLSLEYPGGVSKQGITAFDIREVEEKVAASLAMQLLAEGCGLESPVFFPEVTKEAVRTERTLDCYADLVAGRVILVNGEPLPVADIATDPRVAGPRAILSGSFNPAHAGHIAMVERAAEQLDPRPNFYFELAIQNADKPPLDIISLFERLDTLAGRPETVLVTAAGTFREKIQLFPHALFIVGHDTASRIVDQRFYTEDVEKVLTEMTVFGGARFLVMAREYNGGNRWELDPAIFPEVFRNHSQTNPAFRMPYSSTEIRRARSQEAQS